MAEDWSSISGDSNFTLLWRRFLSHSSVASTATNSLSSISDIKHLQFNNFLVENMSMRPQHQENMKSACDPLSKAYAPLDARKAFKSAKKVRSLIGLGLLPYQSR